MNHEQTYFGYMAPTDGELKKLKSSVDLTRRYPKTLKAVFAPGPVPNTNEILYFSDELAELGINTYWVIGEYQIKNNKISQFLPTISRAGLPGELSQEDAKKVLAWRIMLAKKAGFATILIPDLPSVSNIGRDKFDIAKLKPEFEDLALDLAKLAEEYQVEYFSPVNEYEHMLFSNGYSIDEVAKLENEFYSEIIPKIRAIYQGKIIIKTGDLGNWERLSKLSMKGADLFGVGNAYAMGKGEIFKDESAKAQAADLVSQRDNVPWFESEFMVYREIDQQNWMGRIASTYPMDKAYQEGVSAFEKNSTSRTAGFTFMSWTGVGRIRGSAAAEVMKNFFKNWKPTAKVTSNLNPIDFVVSEPKVTFWDKLLSVPKFYLGLPDIITGKSGPRKDESYVPQGGPGGCKNKEECEAFCAKPENYSTCKRFGGGEDEGPRDKGSPDQSGPGGCKSDAECHAYCDLPEHKAECDKFMPRN